MNQQAIRERLRASPNPIIDSYRQIVNQHHRQIIDQNRVGWKILELTVIRHPDRFFNANGHWKSWRDQQLRSLAKSDAEDAVSIGVTLTQYWRGKSLNLMQEAMIKPYLKLDKKWFLS